ncbi:hypothetical protein [Microbulbifer sp. ARAS458-1]|uniref:hypothetical protein n=1 Tax=Microbulbifer sp. ARAS458-1 TaxID=3140242 RepID=UPI003877ED39
MASQTNWIQRYVDNVRTHLPAHLREDVGSELLSDLLDQRDDLQASLKRSLYETEILDLLKQRGHPMAVAADYQPRRALVSAPLFPVYMQVLKWTLLILVIISAIETVAGLYVEEQPNLIGAAIGWFARFYESGIHAFAWVTLVFYLTGEGLGYRQVFSRWDPRSMPHVVDNGQRIKRFDSSVEFVVTLLAMAWLNDTWLFGDGAVGGFTVMLSPALQSLLPWLNIALGASVLIALHKLFSPFWTRPRLLINGALNIFWLVLLAVLLSLPAPLSIEWGSGDLWQSSQGGWQVAVGVVIAITAWDLFGNLRNLVQARSPASV